MSSSSRVALLSFLFLLVLSGCAVNRSEVDIPAASSARAVSNGPVVVIGTVTDERQFADAPPDPRTPSLGSEGSSPEIKARAIARKRNSYGMAMGDVLLPSGQTVTSLVRDNARVALQDAGYQVKEADQAGAGGQVVNIRIKRFWAWLNPKFYAVTLNAEIETEWQWRGRSASVSANAEDTRQFATDGAWSEVVAKALTEFRAQAKGQSRLK